jgi:hypothetical protein
MLADGSPTERHAVVWNGTAGSAVDLHPTNLSNFNVRNQSEAFGTDGTHQVGYAIHDITTASHAILWNGGPNSAVDLTPTSGGRAYGVLGNQQVGESGGSATLWTGTAASAVNLHPAALTAIGFTHSIAYGTNGTQQVGYAYGDDLLAFAARAILWEGSAGSYVDLHALLPSDFTESKAYSIDAAGNVYGTAFHLPDSTNYAIVWSVPEPSTASVVAVAAVAVLSKRLPRRRPSRRS